MVIISLILSFLCDLPNAEVTGGVTLRINMAPPAPHVHPAMEECAEKTFVIKVCLYKPHDSTVLSLLLQDTAIKQLSFILFNQSYTVKIA